MASVGKPWRDTSARKKTIQDILALVLRTWNSFPKPASTDIEIHINKEFHKALLRDKSFEKKYPSLGIVRDRVRDDPSTGDEKRIDIYFATGNRTPDNFFAFECKRLNYCDRKGKKSSNAEEYAGENGMMRFVSGKYVGDLPEAGMIGYVLDGDTKSAINSVKRAVKLRNAILLVSADANGEYIRHSRYFPKNHNVLESEHVCLPHSGTMILQHIFLPA